MKDLVELFKAQEDTIDPEVLNNASTVICEIISRRTQVANYSQFEAYFNSKECLQTLFDRLFRSEVLIKYINPIITTLLQQHLNVRKLWRANDYRKEA